MYVCMMWVLRILYESMVAMIQCLWVPTGYVRKTSAFIDGDRGGVGLTAPPDKKLAR
jgi:hypothetical protein